MKTISAFLFALLSFGAQAQSSDTVAIIRQVDTLIKQATKLRVAGNSEVALPLADSARALAAGQLGEVHPSHATALYRLADVYFDMGQYAEAIRHYNSAKHIWEKTTGKEHSDYANNLNNLGDAYSVLFQFAKAEPYYLEARDILANVEGKHSAAYANTLHNLALLYADWGQYEKSEPVYREALEARTKSVGQNHPDYALTVLNYANLYLMMGQYDKAESFYLEAIRIFEKTTGKQDWMYALALYNYAGLLAETQRDNEAEQFFLETQSVFEKTLGTEHPYYAALQNGLSLLYRNLGQMDKAEKHLLYSKEIKGRTQGKTHPDYLLALINLAGLYGEMEKFADAESYSSEALNLTAAELGKDHPLYKEALDGQAELYARMKQYGQSERCYLEVKNLSEKFSTSESDYATTLNNLADVYIETKQYDKARPLYQEALRLYTRTLGNRHIFYSNTLENLASAYWATGDPSGARSCLTEASLLNRAFLRENAKFLTEWELAESIRKNKFEQKTNEVLSFTHEDHVRFPEMAGIALDNALFFNGFIKENIAQLERFVAQAPDSIRELHSRWKGYCRRLAAEYAKPFTERDSAGMADLEEKANTLEKKLTRAVSGFGEALRQVSWQEVQAALKPGEAAIEFVRYRYSVPEIPDSAFYSALLLRRGDTLPLFIPLFEEQTLQTQLAKTGNDRAVAARGIIPTGVPGRAVYRTVWEPLEPYLHNIKTVYYAPAGLLHRLNLGALATSKNAILSDRHEMVLLGSTRQLTKPMNTQGTPATGAPAVVYGGIFYDMDSTAISAANVACTSDLAARRGPGDFRFTDSTLRTENWPYLKWTDKEAATISSILGDAGVPVTWLKGYAATEESFKGLEKFAGGTEASGSPRIIHLSTHGYFFPDPESTADARALVFKVSDQPLLRSGLLLAGANHSWATGRPLRAGMEDGILTAYEISQLNLSNTELVVLSACETGLGDIRGNEGVYGLQRALKIAGARYVIMSLWQVPDFQTQQLMTAFYRNWLTAGMAVRQAFHAAQQELRAKGLDPYFWAGFVLVE